MDTAYRHDPEHYDRTRSLPADILAAIVETLAAELPPAGQVLDLGAGSGRFALPLAGRGVQVVAADLSAAMLRHLLAKRGAESVFPQPVLADALHLPFCQAAFPAAFSVHTLHLVADLSAAVDEIARVVRPGGLFALGYIDHNAEAPVGWVMLAWRRALAARGHSLNRPLRRDYPEIVADLSRRFGEPRTLTAARWEKAVSPAEALRAVSERLFTPYWGLPDAEHAEIVAELHRAALSTFGSDLHTPRPDPRRFVWHFFRR